MISHLYSSGLTAVSRVRKCSEGIWTRKHFTFTLKLLSENPVLLLLDEFRQGASEFIRSSGGKDGLVGEIFADPIDDNPILSPFEEKILADRLLKEIWETVRAFGNWGGWIEALDQVSQPDRSLAANDISYQETAGRPIFLALLTYSG